MNTKICTICGEELSLEMFSIHNKNNDGTICYRNQCKKCKADIRRLKKYKTNKLCVCKNCNKEFYKIDDGSTKGIFCSRECFFEHIGKHKKEEKPKVITVKVCPVCNKEFEGGNKQYCSSECRYENFKKNNREKARERFIPEKKTCKECGEEFYTEYKSSKIYCSLECGKKHTRKTSKIKRRMKGNSNGKVDSSISLNKLYKRYRGICAICGKKCDYDDYIVDEGGNVIAGNNYPSIDHIMPIAKGGTHIWNNVQLAHRLCNSFKRDQY